jgi:hypothetical protein
MAETVQALLATVAGWAVAHPRGPRIGIGDLSVRCGGAMPGHASHRRGLDADIRPVRGDGMEGPVSYGQPGYSQSLTQDLVNRLRANRRLRVQYIFFNDPGIRGVRPWPNHHNHLHVRFFPPAGVTPELEIPELAGELELAKRGPVLATLSWQKSVITSYPPLNIPSGGGVYIVEKLGAPLYVGEAESFKARWGGRLQAAYQIGMVPGQPLTVWFGTHKPDSSLARKEAQDVRRAIEHAIIRTLIKRGVVAQGSLRNRRSFKEFDVVAPMQILKLLPPPYVSKGSVDVPEYRGNVLRIRQGTRYELPAQEWGQELGL